jgi:hypothetical protein
VCSYDRNTFTRGHPCLCLVQSPIYTSAAATCPGSPQLRRRSSDPGLGGVAPLRTPRPHLHWPRTRCPRPARLVPGPLGTSSPEHGHSCLRHRRQAPPGGAIPAQQNSHSMSGISVFVSARTAKVSPRDRSRTQTEGCQRGRTRVMLPKTNFPNSSPSSVRVVLNLRWAELTIDLIRVKNGLRNSPGWPTLTRQPEKRRA